MDKRIVRSLILGASSLIGFFVTDKLYKVTVNYIEKDNVEDVPEKESES